MWLITGWVCFVQVMTLPVVRQCFDLFLAHATQVVGALRKEVLREVSIDVVDEVGSS